MNGVCCRTVRTIPCDCRWILKLPALPWPEHSRHHYSMDSTNPVPKSKSDYGRSMKTHDYGASYLQIGWYNLWIGQCLHILTTQTAWYQEITRCIIVLFWQRCVFSVPFAWNSARRCPWFVLPSSAARSPVAWKTTPDWNSLASSSRYSNWNRLKQHAACINTKKARMKQIFLVTCQNRKEKVRCRQKAITVEETQKASNPVYLLSFCSVFCLHFFVYFVFCSWDLFLLILCLFWFWFWFGSDLTICKVSSDFRRHDSSCLARMDVNPGVPHFRLT